jgi:hypothetical protein
VDIRDELLIGERETLEQLLIGDRRPVAHRRD